MDSVSICAEEMRQLAIWDRRREAVVYHRHALIAEPDEAPQHCEAPSIVPIVPRYLLNVVIGYWRRCRTLALALYALTLSTPAGCRRRTT